MKYFRHFSDARSSIKLQNLKEELGLVGYARYWLLLELMNSKFNGVVTQIEVHYKELANTLDTRSKRATKEFIETCHRLDILSLDATSPTTLILDMPILMQLMDKDSKYNRKRVADKSLEAKPIRETKKDIKEEDKEPEEDKEKEVRQDSGISVDSFLDLFNSIVGGKDKVKRFPGYHLPRKALDNFIETTGFPQFRTSEQWEKILREEVLTSDFLMGRSDTKFNVTVDWLVDQDNAFKVLSGKYSSADSQGQGSSNLDSLILSEVC